MKTFKQFAARVVRVVVVRVVSPGVFNRDKTLPLIFLLGGISLLTE